MDFGMTKENLEELIDSISVKHDDIGIKDQGFASRLGELFERIYSDFNQGSHAFGMFKCLFIKNEREYPEQDYFVKGVSNSVANQVIVHSLFTSSLTSLRRIIDESRDWKDCFCIKNLQYKVENEIKNKIPQNQEVVEWFDILTKKYEDAKNKIEPILTYIDNRIAHHNRKWDRKLVKSTSRKIETAFESVNAYNNAFRVFYVRVFYESGESGTRIGEGEKHAALFLGVYYGCKRLNAFKNELPQIIGDTNEDVKKSLQILNFLDNL